MRPIQLAAIALPMLLLAGCGGGSAPPAPAAVSSEAAVAAPAAPTQAAAPAADDALAPLVGTWALDASQCDKQVLKISKARFEGADTGCDITTFTDNGDGTFVADMSCAGAQEKVQMRPIFGPTGEGIDLVYLNRDNLKSEVFRCEAAAK